MAQIVSEFQATHVAAFGSTGTKNILQFHLQKFIYKCAIALAWRMQREGKGRGKGEQGDWGWKGATQAAGIRKQNAAQASEKLMASKKKTKYCSSATGSNRQQQQQQ